MTILLQANPKKLQKTLPVHMIHARSRPRFPFVTVVGMTPFSGLFGPRSLVPGPRSPVPGDLGWFPGYAITLLLHIRASIHASTVLQLPAACPSAYLALSQLAASDTLQRRCRDLQPCAAQLSSLLASAWFLLWQSAARHATSALHRAVQLAPSIPAPHVLAPPTVVRRSQCMHSKGRLAHGGRRVQQCL